jgi:Domain of unknown function (DUF4328)/Uncharacterised protein family UPF0547/Protein of unknown function (DUF2510)
MGDNGESGTRPPAGWYPDPTNPGHERLWTGERWIAWIRPNRVDRAEESPAGWREDVGHVGFERLWSGEMWTEEIRRVGEEGPPGPGAPAAGEVASARGAGPGAPGAGLRPAPTRPGGPGRFDNAPPEKLGTLGLWTIGALVLTSAGAIAQLIADQAYIGVLNGIINGPPPSLGHVESVVSAVQTTRDIYVSFWLVVVVLFLIWFYRAYRNLIRTGISDVRYAPGWAVGAWFIPFFNFVRPKQVANDIWKGSAAAATIGIERRSEIPLPGLLNWWWAFWLGGGLLIGFGNQAITNANAHKLYTASSLHGERTGVWLEQGGFIVQIAAAVMLILLIRQISRFQDEHFTWAAAQGGGVPGAGAYAATSGGATTAPPNGAIAATGGVPARTVPGAPPTGGEETKICPDCAETIKAAAKVCRYCGYRFDQDSSDG